jgi:hypothetical protein
MKLKTIEIDQIIDAFFAPFKDQQFYQIQGDKEKFFEEQALLLKVLLPEILIRIIRKDSISVQINLENTTILFWISSPNTNNLELKGSTFLGRNNIRLKNRILKCSIPQLAPLFQQILEHIEVCLFHHKKTEKLNALRKIALQKQLDSLLKMKQWEYEFEESENKTALQISIARNRVIEFPFYYKSFQKDISKLPEIIESIEHLKTSILSIPNYIIVKHKIIKK